MNRPYNGAWPAPQIPTAVSRFIALLCCQSAFAKPPSLELPMSCSPGLDCFIQNYFDHDPSHGWVDYSCGHLSYDGHAGTDFRLSGLEAMHKGVAVMAAANGVVVGLRDGEPDVSVMMRSGNLNLSKHAAGNAVRINHGDGWETQYSHMLQGSVIVRVGQQVRAGDQLGRVGLSGNTAFPHMQLLALLTCKCMNFDCGKLQTLPKILLHLNVS